MKEGTEMSDDKYIMIVDESTSNCWTLIINQKGNCNWGNKK